MRVALSIAGSDPTGGAGLQADLQVFQSLGVHGQAIPAALTVQDGARVLRVLPVFPSVVLDQMRALLRDAWPDAVKLGALATDDVVRSVALGLRELDDPDRPRPPIVVDPVLAASDGTPLLERRAHATLIGLFEGAAVVTPNLAEAEVLTRFDTSCDEGVESAGRAIVEDMGAEAALVKGGHTRGAPRDLWVSRSEGSVTCEWMTGERIDVAAHGTGCALASAITAHLARGTPPRDAVVCAREFVTASLRRAERRGSGTFLVYP